MGKVSIKNIHKRGTSSYGCMKSLVTALHKNKVKLGKIVWNYLGYGNLAGKNSEALIFRKTARAFKNGWYLQHSCMKTPTVCPTSTQFLWQEWKFGKPAALLVCGSKWKHVFVNLKWWTWWETGKTHIICKCEIVVLIGMRGGPARFLTGRPWNWEYHKGISSPCIPGETMHMCWGDLKVSSRKQGQGKLENWPRLECALPIPHTDWRAGLKCVSIPLPR